MATTKKVLEACLADYTSKNKSIKEISAKHRIGTATLYAYLKNNNIPLRTKSTQTAKEAEMQKFVDDVDAYRKQGMELKEAIKKTGSSAHISTYYTYRDKLKKKDVTKTEQVIEKIPTKKSMPQVAITPHTLEYIHLPLKAEKSDKRQQQQQLVMMIGSTDTLIAFVKKFRDELGV